MSHFNFSWRIGLVIGVGETLYVSFNANVTDFSFFIGFLLLFAYILTIFV